LLQADIKTPTGYVVVSFNSSNPLAETPEVFEPGQDVEMGLEAELMNDPSLSFYNATHQPVPDIPTEEYVPVDPNRELPDSIARMASMLSIIMSQSMSNTNQPSYQNLSEKLGEDVTKEQLIRFREGYITGLGELFSEHGFNRDFDLESLSNPVLLFRFLSGYRKLALDEPPSDDELMVYQMGFSAGVFNQNGLYFDPERAPLSMEHYMVFRKGTNGDPFVYDFEDNVPHEMRSKIADEVNSVFQLGLEIWLKEIDSDIGPERLTDPNALIAFRDGIRGNHRNDLYTGGFETASSQLSLRGLFEAGLEIAGRRGSN